MPFALNVFPFARKKQKAKDLLVAGRSLCFKWEYTKAIAEFTKALQLRGVPLSLQITILDERAAARERLGGTVNLELALQDAGMMTQLSNVDSAGYIRAGKIYVLLNQDKSALDILEYGLKQVGQYSWAFMV